MDPFEMRLRDRMIQLDRAAPSASPPVLSSQPTVMPGPSAPPRTRWIGPTFRTRSMTASLVGALVVAAVIGIGGWYLTPAAPSLAPGGPRTAHAIDWDSGSVRLTADSVRIVPGGSAVRDGAFLGKGVVCMPPMYVNVGAYVDDDTMIDSHALVGSCAQVGKRVHLSAAAQIGGVLEPVGALPVIVEDDVLVGGNCGVYEGCIVGAGAVLAAGTILTGSTPVYDLVRDAVYRRAGDQPLMIPAGAVVVPGARAVTKGRGKELGISLYTPVIIKYRDEKTDQAVRLEELLR